MSKSPRRVFGLLSLACVLIGGRAEATRVLLIEDQGGFGAAASILTADGHAVTVINNEFANGYANLLNTPFLSSNFDLVVYGERGDGIGAVLPASVAASLETYIQAGGHLLVTGYDTLGSPSDANLAALVRSTTFSDLVSGDPNWETANIDHFALNGVYGDFRGLTFSATGYDDDVLTPDASQGAIALATIPGLTARIIYTDILGVGGSVGYWNGGVSGGASNAQPDFSDGGIPMNIFRNYVAGIVVPEPASLILTSVGLLGGLGVARARRRRDG